MTITDISRKLIKNNFKHYSLFFFSVLFSIMMVGAYGVLQFSSTITDVLVDGGSTQVISVGMFYVSMIGIIMFLLYADALFLRYKSREIGVFLSLGIKRKAINKIVHKEYSILFQIASLIGLLLSIPVAFLCWSFLSIFIKTEETVFHIGWIGIVIAGVFTIIAWLILRVVNSHYIKKVDIMKILKSSDENEEIKGLNFLIGILGFLAIPVGIVLFFTLDKADGFIRIFKYSCLFTSLYGIYVFVIQIASVGSFLKKINKRAYYKNIVFYNLIKQKMRQYTRSIFVATILITITIFGLGFMSSGFVDGYITALNNPYDYLVLTTSQQSEVDEQAIYALAEESDIDIAQITSINGLLIGKENNYRDGESDWSSRIVINEDNYNQFVKDKISVPKGTYTLYYDKSMEHITNVFHSNVGLFYNPTTKQDFKLHQNKFVRGDGLFNSKSFFSSFLILNNEDYKELVKTTDEIYKITANMFNVDQSSNEFDKQLIQCIVNASDGEVYGNWHLSAVFDKNGGKAEYYLFKGNENKAARCWVLYPFSKLGSTGVQFASYATYLMLMLFIAIILFVSSIMVIGLKIIGTIWDDKTVYDALAKIGMKRKDIVSLITKQMSFIYFIPSILGCIIGVFTTYRIILAANIIYISQVMMMVLGLVLLVLLFQIVIFFILRRNIIHDYID